IIPTHAHLDHVGAVPFLASRFNAPIICTPFTSEVIKRILKDEDINLKNEIRSVEPGSNFLLDDIEIEFINMTHSTPQTVVIAIHTKYGTILYANDFKFDDDPVLGEKADTKRIEEIGKKGVIALICDTTNADIDIKTESESIAREMLRTVLKDSVSDKTIIVTTFASHIARLKSILDFALEMDREVIFLGRSLKKYIKAAEKVGLVDFSSKTEIVGFSSKIDRKLTKVMMSGKERFLLVVTGHQGEENSVLSKIADGKTPFHIDSDDHVIFSCAVIPTETSILSRKVLEEKLAKHNPKISRDIHVSGHAASDDLKELIRIACPKHIIPAHGTEKKKLALAAIAEKMKVCNIHIVNDGDRIVIDDGCI
ncbi:ribonuclease J, partial [Candidatus Woesearchaeota archaeon CG08_land_8_20_14_0_20_43_7]